LIGNTYACKRLEILLASFADAAASSWNHALESLDSKLSKYLDGAPIRIDGRPRASGVLDTVRAAQANGVKVPHEFMEKPVIDMLEKAVVKEWFDGKQPYNPFTFHRLTAAAGCKTNVISAVLPGYLHIS
jgi:acid phosphatase